MPRLEPSDIAWFTSPGELRAWLVEHHATATERWIGMHPKASGRAAELAPPRRSPAQDRESGG